MQQESYFGIGCFNFGMSKPISFEFQGKEYLEELEEALNKIPNLKNLNIESDQDFQNEVIEINEQLPSLENSGDYFPKPLILEVKFELYIPFRIQAHFSNVEEKYLFTFSENFRVLVSHDYFFPVAIVEVLDPDNEPDPSDAVKIIREFLKEEFDKNQDSNICFETLGPSPFHVDCFVKPFTESKESDWLLESKETPKKGYDEVTIYYNTNRILNAVEALDYLKLFLTEELGFFYQFISFRNDRMHQWVAIQSKLRKLIEIQNSTGVKGFIKRIYSRSNVIENIFTELAKFEGKEIMILNERNNSYNKIYFSGEKHFFKTIIDEKLKEEYSYPVKQTYDLINFFESRRIKNLELITALIASIIGGAIGALLFAYFK